MLIHRKKISYKDFLISYLRLLKNQNIDFTGVKQCVNPYPRVPSGFCSFYRKDGEHGDQAGKNLVKASLFKRPGDAMSLNPASRLFGQGAGLGSLGLVPLPRPVERVSKIYDMQGEDYA